MVYEWIKTSIRDPMPSNAIAICGDKDGSIVYFGQCTMDNQVLGAKIVPRRKKAYVAYQGLETQIINFKILVDNSRMPRIWLKSSEMNESSFEDAIACGHDSNNNKFYVGKTFHTNICVPGYINSVTKQIHIPFGDREYKYSEFEILMNPERL